MRLYTAASMLAGDSSVGSLSIEITLPMEPITTKTCAVSGTNPGMKQRRRRKRAQPNDNGLHRVDRVPAHGRRLLPRNAKMREKAAHFDPTVRKWGAAQLTRKTMGKR